MNKLLLTALVALSTIATAEAQCYSVSPGWMQINHRIGLLYGRNFIARVACTRFAPVFVYWRGGAMCIGRTFYGRNGNGAPFSCRVSGISRR